MDNKKKNILIFVILFLITNLIFLPWLAKGHMSTDSYNIANIGYQEYSKNFSLIDGRFVVAIGTALMDILNIPIQVYTSIILEIAIFLCCIAILVLKCNIERWKKPKNLWGEILLIIASYYTIFNFLYIENLHFIECGAMSLSLLLFILAAKQIVEKHKQWLVKSLLFLTIGLMCYQGTISMFVITLLVFSMCKGNSAKQITKDFLQGLSIACIGILVNQLSIKIVEKICHLNQGRDINLSSIGNNITYTISNFLSVLKYTGYLIPRYSFLIILSIIEALIIFKIIRQNKQTRDKQNETILLQQFAIIIIGIGAGFIVSLINLSGFWAARTRFSIGALIGLLWIHLWIKTDFTDKKNWLNILLMICFITYGFMNSIHYVTAIKDHIQLNELDKQVAIDMQKNIANYEQQHQVKITKVAVIVKYNESLKSFYSELRCYGNLMMARGMNTQWAAVGCYNYYTNSKLQIYEPTEAEMQNYLEQNQEYLCIGDTLYITAYMH